VYFTERSLPILGANALTGYDVAFDLEGGRVGFARSRCGFSGRASGELCECPGDKKPVCGADGSTFLSACYAKCFAMPVLWDGPCPARIPQRCRAVLFSTIRGCQEVARTALKGNGRCVRTAGGRGD
jgi:hypothetical protein